jgi:exopolyphosphatase/guanosine-5'-triphosphate,3'-diphosphate pyrophosphatase
MDHLALDSMLVSGKGLREGLALDINEAPTPTVAQTRAAAVDSVAGRFSGYSHERAAWRTEIAAALQRVLVEDLDAVAGSALRDAALLLDIGRAVDFYDKHVHTVDIVLTAEIPGYSQADRALLAAIIEKAGEPRSNLRRYKPVLTSEAMEMAEQCGLILALADGIEPRTHADSNLLIRRQEDGDEVRISVPLAAPWSPGDLIRRVARVFGKDLLIGDNGGDGAGVSIDVH